MSLEATMVCVDNSEWTRNGDYAPNRFQAQTDAVNELASAKTSANPENTVGVLTMAGKKPTVLVTPTAELGKVLNSLAGLQIDGEVSFSISCQIAQLALKHRENKNQRQRIVMFVGSPLSETKEQMVKLAKKLKKNNVAMDIVSFGDCEANEEKLTAFIATVNNGDSCHLVSVPAGTILLDQLFSSPIYQSEGGGGYGGGAMGGEGAGGEGMEFGVDPNMDPELAMVLRISMEEERARQGTTESGQAAGGAPGATGGASAAAGGGGDANNEGGIEPMDEDALLEQALAMSTDVNEQPAPTDAPAAAGDSAAPPLPAVAATPAATSAPAATPAAPVKQPPPAVAEHEDDPMQGIDDPDLAAALAMSMEDYGGNATAAAPATPATSAAVASAPRGAPMADLLGDSDYVSSVLASLPGVDANDPALQETLRSLQQQQQDLQDDATGSDNKPDTDNKADKKNDQS